MRPLGAIFFGHIGDRLGRKVALQCSLMSMALSTLAIGLLPTYEDMGILAPFGLVFCRMMQGLSIGGEFSGSIVLLTEHAPSHQKSFFCSWADLGSSIGMISASLVILLLNAFLNEEDILSWGWRLPFLLSFFIGIIGFKMRHYIIETPEFLFQKRKYTPVVWPLKIILSEYKRKLFLATSFLMINTTGYYLLVIFLPNQNLGNISKLHGIVSMLFSLIIMMPAIVWGAVLSDKIGQVRCLIMGYTGCLILAVPLIYFSKYGTFVQQLFYQGLFAFCLGFCFGPRSSFAVQVFPATIRYSAVALSYNIGNGVFGGTAPLICALIIGQTGTIYGLVLYIVMASLLSILSVILLDREMTHRKTFKPAMIWARKYISGYKTHK